MARSYEKGFRDELLEQGLRGELLATGRALDLQDLMCQNPNDSDPSAAGTIEKYVFLWTTYCLFTAKIAFFNEAHEKLCQQLSDLTLGRVLGYSEGAAFLRSDAVTTSKYVRAMVSLLEAQEP